MMLSRSHLLALVAGVGFLNANIRPVSKALEESGPSAILDGFGISFVVWLAFGWSLAILARDDSQEARTLDIVIAGLALLGFLLPVATASWVVLGFLALFGMTAPLTPLRSRSAYAVLAFASFRDPIASTLLKIFAPSLLNGDAAVVAALMSIWDGDVARLSNLITAGSGHQLMILTGCTSYSNLSLAMLCWFAISKLTVGMLSIRQWTTGLLVVLAVVAINFGRLSLMGIGPDIYHFMHDGPGALLSEVAMMASTIFISLVGCGYGNKKRPVLAAV